MPREICLIRVSVIFVNSNHACQNYPRLYHNALLAVKSSATMWTFKNDVPFWSVALKVPWAVCAALLR